MQNNRHVNTLKFIFFSLLGIILFFVPVVNNEVPIVGIVNFLQKALGVWLNYLVLFSCTLLFITYILAKVFKVECLQEYHKDDGPIIGIVYLIAVVFDIMVIMNRGPAPVIDPGIGGMAVSLAGSVFLTVTVAGWLVVFIMYAGIVDFIGTLMESIMRPFFKVPGEAAVNAVASFVSAPAVGVYITRQLYEQSVYTEQEATAIITNFSVCSLGFFGVLVSVANVVDLYPQVVLTSFIITFILAAIVIRIPPISKKKTVYANGKVQNIHEKKEDEFKGNLISKAFALALKTASGLTIKTVYIALWEALKFAQKIVAYVITIATVTMLITHYTSLFTWLGKPMIPLLQLLGMPNVAEIAPSTIVGIAEIALPVMLLAGKDIALQSVFFIIVLSTVQIIFFTESAQAMLQSGIPVTALDLVIIFLERTIIAMPMVALAAHLLF